MSQLSQDRAALPRRRVPTSAAEPGPPEMHESVAFNVIAAAQLIKRYDDAHFEAVLGIDVREFIGLVVLNERPGIGAAQLARQLQITAQSATKFIERLAALGYIRVGRAGAGQRLALHITPAGEDMVRRGRRLMGMMNAAKKTQFDPGEWDELNRLLIKLATVIQPYT